PWLGASAVALAEPRTNAIILAGPESQVHDVLSIIGALDEAAGTSLLVRRIRHGDVEQAATLLEETFANAPPGRGIEVWADPRTSFLVVRGTPESLAQARERLSRLDRTVTGFSAFEVRKVLHADPEDLQSILQSLGREATEGLEAGTFAVAVDRPTHSLVLRAEPSVQARLAEVIDTLDQPPPRIYVEAMLVEIVASDALALGFDWLLPFSNTSNDPNPSFGGFALLNPSGGGLTGFEGPDKPAFGARIARRPITIPIVGVGGEIVTVVIPRQSVVITADQGIVKSQVLQHPHLLLISGEEHEIFAGNEVPIPVSNTAANVGVPATNVDFQRQDVGVRLRVRPTLGQGGRVNMDVEIETSQVRSAATLESGSQGPVIQQRAVTTKVVLDDDETALIGMGTLGDTQELDVGTPWFKDIPLLGWLFRRTQMTQVKTHIVVTLQARVQRGPESDIAETIRRRLGVERALSRVRGLARTGDPRWALRVASLEKRDDAVDVAAHFERLGEQTEIISWTWHESPRHDVLLDGFESLADASQAALRARDEGFAGELVPVPAKAR
ncbi:MAG: secretin N-terminal domain-containing protein, partial [Myxococcota bacterium]